MNVTFIIILLGLILLSLWGWFSGFIKMVCVLCSSIICFVLTLFLSPITTGILVGSEPVYKFFYEKVSGNIDLPDTDVSTALQFFDSIEIPEAFEGTLRDGLKDLAEDTETAKDSAGNYIRDSITVIIIKVVAFIITYIIVSILVSLVFMLFKVLSRLPVVNIANRLLGVIVGLALGIFLVCVFMSVVLYLAPGTFGQGIAEDIDSSAILKYISDHNFILPFVKNYLK
ncbi:MAG: CvpA family protein [Lachnospiraceae bacterium]|nr:CvpA family protein [Lachnospiraceae bacterium]